MKRLNIFFTNTSNKFITALLSILGFASCSFITPVMYGTPGGSYFLANGKVVSAETDSAIENIQISVHKINYDDDTIYSDENGNFILDYNYLNTDSLSFNLSFKDIDSTEHCEFETLDTTITFRNLNTSDETENLDSLTIKLKPKE